MSGGPELDARQGTKPLHPNVSVVIPTLNNLSLLLECIESVRLQEYPRENIEIIVVDNASTDRTRDVISQRFPHVKLIAMETNIGFALACNRGAAAATGQYVAFLNNDAVADVQWLASMLAALEKASHKAVCVASRIVSHDGTETEFDGAGSNLFGAGRPTSAWGWSDAPEPPGEGSPILFASGGAMLIERSVFLDVGGFDPAYFAYFEDVDLGWRLWIEGYEVVYAPAAVVRHIGGATGKKTGAHRRYTLWECNALATIIKNYESGNMQRILSAALLLEYKRALLSAGDAIKSEDYHLAGPADRNVSNVERLPKVSVAHIAAIDRLNAILPQLMDSRREIQARRKRSDAEILPLLGRAYKPQFAGKPYAEASCTLAIALDLYGLTAKPAPNRVLIVGSATELEDMRRAAEAVGEESLVAIAVVSSEDSSLMLNVEPAGVTLHRVTRDDPRLVRLAGHADVVIAMPSTTSLDALRQATGAMIVVGDDRSSIAGALVVASPDDPRLATFCKEPGKV